MTSDGQDVRTVLTMTQLYQSPAWRPDGAMLAMPGYVDYETDEGGGLWVVPLDGTAPWLIPGTEAWSCYDAVWTPVEGGWPLFFRAYSSADKIGGVFWFVPGQDAQPTYFSYAAWGPVWSADATRVVFGYSTMFDKYVQTAVYVFETSLLVFTPPAVP
jgi:hypothetical protein